MPSIQQPIYKWSLFYFIFYYLYIYIWTSVINKLSCHFPVTIAVQKNSSIQVLCGAFMLYSFGILIMQREIYPALVLFPAETKNALSFEGDMAVTDVIKFIAGHGSNSHHLMGDNGIFSSTSEFIISTCIFLSF